MSIKDKIVHLCKLGFHNYEMIYASEQLDYFELK